MDFHGLLQYSGKYCGCGSKLEPWQLEEMLDGIDFWHDAKVVLALQNREDVGAYQLSNTVTLVQNIEVITPIVDSAITFGQIAVNHVLSDIYAKGCKPLFAMDFIGVPEDLYNKNLVRGILAGAVEALREAQVSLIGGHTFVDDVIKFGLAVTGISTNGIIENSTAKPGDKLILTKSLGVGVVATAMKLSPQNVRYNEYSDAVNSMLLSNYNASKVITNMKVNACTDVSGFGLLGHLTGLLDASKCNANIILENIPFLQGATRLVSENMLPSIAHKNQDYFELKKKAIFYGKDILSQPSLSLLYDPQTSGGLLISVGEKYADHLLNELKQFGYSTAAIIGDVLTEDDSHRIHVL